MKREGRKHIDVETRRLFRCPCCGFSEPKLHPRSWVRREALRYEDAAGELYSYEVADIWHPCCEPLGRDE